MAAESTPARARGDRHSPQRHPTQNRPPQSNLPQDPASTPPGTGSPISKRRGIAIGIAAAAVAAVVATPFGALAASGAASEAVSTSGSASAGASLTARADSGAGRTGAARADAAAKSANPGSTEEAGVRLHVAPATSTTIDPAKPLTVQVEIENATTEEIAGGTVVLTRADAPIDDADELDAWLGTGDGTPLASVKLGEAESRATSAGGSSMVSFTVPSSALGALDAPVVGLGVSLVVDGSTVATGADAFATPAGSTGPKTTVTLVYPLTVPEQTTGMIDAATLEEWTAQLGLLDRQLDAVADRPVAIGIDPRIIASIRALGSSAPESATAWLSRLGSVTNEIFPLAYADADVALQAQLGLTTMLAPTSFSDVLDPANFATPVAPEPDDGGGQADEQAPVDEPTPTDSEQAPTSVAPTPTGSPTPTPTETAPAPGELPTNEALLAWPYTRTDLAWPADDTVATGDLGRLDAAGLTTSILAPGNVATAATRVSANTSIEGSTALVADGRLNTPLREAADAESETEWRSATGGLLAEFAVAPATDGSALLATFDRDAGEHSVRVGATLDQLARDPAVQPTGLAGVIGAPPVARQLVDEPEDAQRVATTQRMLDLEAETGEFATVLSDPRLLTGPVRRDLLALLDVAWLQDPTAWDAAAAQWLADRRATLASVSVVPSSSVNIFARETPLPITVLNALPYPVTVVVSADPSNGRLVVEESVTETIPAESRSTVNVPIAAGVGRGEVTIGISLASPTGVPVGRTVYISGNVQADWEGLGAAILATAVVLFFGFGIWRNIRRRRKQRAAEAATPAEPVTDGDEADAAAEVAAEAEVAPDSAAEAVPGEAGAPETGEAAVDPEPDPEDHKRD
ncbi:DUF6049 family protein [Agromyces endophyticus]|uniref:DUF6049 family protein n=1 Tax=Agromyces sp. H17E-10 TaxID=2932244 RepID=UPI001FD5C73D|nr:DUF6049 family protein [Agromyces sp. H17E-10]UOQ91003.1 DUF6049 family protein [Agromyces sp. H17E-10]